jgi:hypothetical protein
VPFRSFINSVRKVVLYNWDDEERSCKEYVRDGGEAKDHMFSHFQRIDDWIVEHKSVEDYYALAVKKQGTYTLLDGENCSDHINRFKTLGEATTYRKREDFSEGVVILHINVLKA